MNCYNNDVPKNLFGTELQEKFQTGIWEKT